MGILKKVLKKIPDAPYTWVWLRPRFLRDGLNIGDDARFWILRKGIELTNNTAATERAIPIIPEPMGQYRSAAKRTTHHCGRFGFGQAPRGPSKTARDPPCEERRPAVVSAGVSLPPNWHSEPPVGGRNGSDSTFNVPSGPAKRDC